MKANRFIARLTATVGLLSCVGFAACDGSDTKNSSNLTEENAESMFEFENWYFTSGVTNNMIMLSGEENALFELTANKGGFYARASDNAGDNHFIPSVIRESGEGTWWNGLIIHTDAYIDVVERLNGTIIGYGVIKLTYNEERQWHDPTVLKAATFPKIEGEYQAITEAQVQSLISEWKK